MDQMLALRNNRSHHSFSAKNMRWLKSIANWFILLLGHRTHERVVYLEDRMAKLESAMLLLGEPESELVIAPYAYGMLGEAYRITKNHELVTRREM